MFDIGWTELLVIGALALIVVGPRELPHLLQQVGRWVGQVKRMAREFQRSIEDAARDTDLASMKELRDLRKDLGGLDFRQQAARAQSYLKQPVKVEPAAGAKPAQPAAAADAGAPPAAATAASTPTGTEDGSRRPAEAAPPAAGIAQAGAPRADGGGNDSAASDLQAGKPGVRVSGE